MTTLDELRKLAEAIPEKPHRRAYEIEWRDYERARAEFWKFAYDFRTVLCECEPTDANEWEVWQNECVMMYSISDAVRNKEQPFE